MKPKFLKELKLGKTEARPEAVKFKLTDFVNISALPPIPKNFGHENLIAPKAWGMLGNDSYGDCVFAGAAHETLLWNLEAGKNIPFDSKSVLSDYTAVTGFNPKKPDTDNGTDMKTAAEYRRKTGIVDVHGNRHKIKAYLSITAGNIQEHLAAAYLFSSIGIGIQFPASAMEQFNKGKIWSVVKGSRIEGGHYVCIVAKRKNIEVVTWGSIQGMTTGFFRKYNDESIAYVTEENLINNKSPEGFDCQKLIDCLNSLK